MNEFVPWYEPSAKMMRCIGPTGCGAMVLSADTAMHTEWPRRIDEIHRVALCP